jgi:phosphoglycolate phosphatase-like HAD superfamily hydrolase
MPAQPQPLDGVDVTISRRTLLGGAAALLASLAAARTDAAAAARWAFGVNIPSTPLAALTGDPLPSWNAGPRKQAILDFVAAATNEQTVDFVPVPERVATFDMDGTLWIEMPLYTQSTFTVESVRAAAANHPDWKTTPPFAAAIAGDREAMAKFSNADWQTLMGATHAGMTLDEYITTAAQWLASQTHPCFDRLYTELVYQPMLEMMAYLRANDFRTYIVSGSGQEFMRAFAEPVFGVPPEQVVGTTFQLTYQMGSDGAPVMLIESAVLMDDNGPGKPQDIALMIGRRPVAAVGNSGGDQQMLEWTGAGERARLMMLIHHDDAEREYAYGPAGGLPNTGIGVFTEALLDEANQRGWFVVSMKHDWKQIFSDA